MKKIILVLLLCVSLITMSSCSNDYESYENEIKLIIPDEYLPHLKVAEVPSYTFSFEGSINVSPKVSNTNEICFVNNDDFALSNIIEQLLIEYEEKGLVKYIVVSEEEKSTTRMNKLNKDGEKDVQESVKMDVVDNIIYNKHAYISLENGLSLSINFRTFRSDYEGIEKTYYTWQYTSSMRMYLHYPFIVEYENDLCQIILIPLPTGVSYAVGTNLSLSSITNSTDWDTEEYHRFRYFGYNDEAGPSSIDLEKSINEVKNYYKTLFNATEENGKVYFEYLENNFEVEFSDSFFLITHI